MSFLLFFVAVEDPQGVVEDPSFGYRTKENSISDPTIGVFYRTPHLICWVGISSLTVKYFILDSAP